VLLLLLRTSHGGCCLSQMAIKRIVCMSIWKWYKSWHIILGTHSCCAIPCLHLTTGYRNPWKWGKLWHGNLGIPMSHAILVFDHKLNKSPARCCGRQSPPLGHEPPNDKPQVNVEKYQIKCKLYPVWETSV
jgi:hypothetical protein